MNGEERVVLTEAVEVNTLSVERYISYIVSGELLFPDHATVIVKEVFESIYDPDGAIARVCVDFAVL